MVVLKFLILFTVIVFTAESVLQSYSKYKNVSNFVSICDYQSSSTALSGELLSPNYPNIYPMDLRCYSDINASHWLYDIEIKIPTFNTEANFDWLAIQYESNQTWVDVVPRLNLPIFPPKTSECAGSSILFLLDRSEAIFKDFYNNNITMFVAELTTHYAFVDDKTTQNPYHSRFGIIEFSDNATVSVPLDDYKRIDFLSLVHTNIRYNNGGESNVTQALQLAYNEFVKHGIPDNGAPLAIILVVNDISTFHFDKTLEAMKQLKTIVHLPMGIIVPGLPGIPMMASQTFQIFGIIFICEATSAIGFDLKKSYLELVQRLAANTEKSSKQLYGIALYGTQIYQHINMQPFADFNNTLTSLINNVNENNLPNGGQTILAPILNELYTTLTTNLSSNQYATLIMGQVTNIQDPVPSNTAATKIAALSSDIYVVDETHFSFPTIWHTITQDKSNHIINGSLLYNPDDIFSTLKSTFLKDANNMLC